MVTIPAPPLPALAGVAQLQSAFPVHSLTHSFPWPPFIRPFSVPAMGPMSTPRPCKFMG